MKHIWFCKGCKQALRFRCKSCTYECLLQVCVNYVNEDAHVVDICPSCNSEQVWKGTK